MISSKTDDIGTMLSYSLISPVTRSASVNRPSVTAAASQMKASKVRLFRNGDPFFKGIMLAITPGRFRTFDSLLAELNKTTLCDPSVLHKGVRYIFTLSGEQVRSLDQLQDGNAYVCASTPVFREMDYSRITKPTNWSMNFRTGDESKTGITKSFGDFKDQDRNYIEPKMVYTIRAGPRPRNMARSLLNKRTARSFDQVMTDLADSVSMETGTIRQLYSITGNQVLSLKDFFQEDSIFVAFGSEKFSLSELKLNEQESKFVSCSGQRNSRAATAATPTTTKRNESLSPNGRCPKAAPNAGSNSVQVVSPETGNNDHWLILSATTPCNFPGDMAVPDYPNLPERAVILQQDHPTKAYANIEHHQDRSSRAIQKIGVASPEVGTAHHMSASSCTAGDTSKRICSAQNKLQSPARHSTIMAAVSAANAVADVNYEQVNVIREEHSIPPTLQIKYHIGPVGSRYNYVSLRTGTDRKTQLPVAIKIYHRTKMDVTTDYSVLTEVTLMKRMKHANLLHLLDDLNTPTELYLILELPQGGDLFETIVSSAHYCEADASQMFFQLCFALSFLHSMNIVHRNVRPESLLVTVENNGQKHLKLCDFTMATEIVGPVNTRCGTLAYMAPEMLSENLYTTKVDIWSAGCVGYFMLCGYLPFTGSSKDDLLNQIRLGPINFPSPAWDSISYAAKDLIVFMLEENVKIRSSAADVLDHPWLIDHEQKRTNLQPAIGTNLRRFIVSDTYRRTFSSLIGLRHLDRKHFQLPLVVYDDSSSSVDATPPHPSPASTSSSSRMNAGSSTFRTNLTLGSVTSKH